MKNLREELEKIVNYASENMGNDVLLSQTVDDLLSLFKQQMKEERKELINLIRSLDEPKEAKSLFGGAYSYFMDGCIAVKKQILKNIESL